jgi:hypothetical protein
LAPFELLFHPLELGDQIVDALHRVLACLIVLARARIQSSEPSLAFREQLPQGRVLTTQCEMTLRQLPDYTLEALEVLEIRNSPAAALRHIVAFAHPAPSRARPQERNTPGANRAGDPARLLAPTERARADNRRFVAA